MFQPHLFIDFEHLDGLLADLIWRSARCKQFRAISSQSTSSPTPSLRFFDLRRSSRPPRSFWYSSSAFRPQILRHRRSDCFLNQCFQWKFPCIAWVGERAPNFDEWKFRCFAVKNRSQIATSIARIEGSHLSLAFIGFLHNWLRINPLPPPPSAIPAAARPAHSNASQRVILNVLLMLGSPSLLLCLHFENLKRTLSSSFTTWMPFRQKLAVRGTYLLFVFEQAWKLLNSGKFLLLLQRRNLAAKNLNEFFAAANFNEHRVRLTAQAAKSKGRDHEKLYSVREFFELFLTRQSTARMLFHLWVWMESTGALQFASWGLEFLVT